jgi:hypothetical protein
MLDAILHHHERGDGSGFPDRLSGNAIPLTARLVAIANRFDNLVNPLDPGARCHPPKPCRAMWTGSRRPSIGLLQLFVRAMGVYPPGSIVQLSDGRIGAVISSAAADRPLCPQVMIYAPEVPRRQSIMLDLARADGITIDRPLRLHDRPAEELDYLLPRRKINWSYMAKQK